MFRGRFNTLLAVILLVFAQGTSADLLEKLKNTPATKYDLGKVRLEIGTMVLNDEIKGEKLGDSSFEFGEFSVEDDNESLRLVVSINGPAKRMSEDLCKKLDKEFNNKAPFAELKQKIWPNLTEAEYKSLDELFYIETGLVSKENESFKIRCH